MKKFITKQFIILAVPFIVLSLALVSVVALIQDSDSDSNTSDSVAITLPVYSLFFEDTVTIGEGKDPHSFEPSFSDISKIESSKLLVFNGGLDEWAHDVVESRDIDPAVEILDIVNDQNPSLLIKFDKDSHSDDDHKGEKDQDHGNEEYDEDHKHEKEEDHDGEDKHDDDHDDEKHSHEGHDHGKYDPHIWISPKSLNAMLSIVLENDDIKDTISLKNSDLQSEITALDELYSQTLSQCSDTSMLTSYDSLAYIARDYNVSIKPLQKTEFLSPSDVQSAQEFVSQNNITSILITEAAQNATSFAENNNLETLNFDLLEKSVPSGTVTEIYTNNLNTITNALGCSQ